ncbi:MAG TPA: hypothetical protein VFH51_10550 [Myxococcota bacterium]|nr:hypothetical protein [Myxococcota bacterium]
MPDAIKPRPSVYTAAQQLTQDLKSYANDPSKKGKVDAGINGPGGLEDQIAQDGLLTGEQKKALLEAADKLESDLKSGADASELENELQALVEQYARDVATERERQARPASA